MIGSHTAVSLIEHGFEVVIIDNLVNSNKDVLEGIHKITAVRPQFYQIDMCDALALKAVFERHHDAAGVIHFAALKAVKESVDKPLSYYRNNLYALINLIDAMLMFDIPSLVFSSSATVYGEPDKLPLTEDSPVKPATSPYGNTKKIGENIIRDVAASNPDFSAIALRYFNPIGAHPSGHIGELPIGVPNNLMPFITQTAAGVRAELLVFGKDYNTSDGTAVRDYLHVVDLAEAHVKTLERLISKGQHTNYEVYNLGTGKGSTVLEVIQSFEKTSGRKLAYKIVGRRAGDVEQLYASTALANEALSWKAELSLDEMTASSWLWEKKVRGLDD